MQPRHEAALDHESKPAYLSDFSGNYSANYPLLLRRHRGPDGRRPHQEHGYGTNIASSRHPNPHHNPGLDAASAGNLHAVSHSDRRPSYGHAFANPWPVPNQYAHAGHGHFYPHAHGDAYSDTHGNAYRNSHRYAHRNRYGYAHRNAFSHPYA